MLTNPYITNQAPDSVGIGSSYIPNSSVVTLKKVRTICNNTVSNYSTLSSYMGYSVPVSTIAFLSGNIGFVDSLFPIGTYNPTGPTIQR
jgi:hypothetical protein